LRCGLTRGAACRSRLRAQSVLARLLEETVGQHERRCAAHAAAAPGGVDAPNLFCGLRAPAIPLTSYLQRIFKYANCSPACYVLAFIYLERMMAVRGGAQRRARARSARKQPPDECRAFCLPCRPGGPCDAPTARAARGARTARAAACTRACGAGVYARAAR
jgi:hypothetical protein